MKCETKPGRSAASRMYLANIAKAYDSFTAACLDEEMACCPATLQQQLYYLNFKVVAILQMPRLRAITSRKPEISTRMKQLRPGGFMTSTSQYRFLSAKACNSFTAACLDEERLAALPHYSSNAIVLILRSNCRRHTSNASIGNESLQECSVDERLSWIQTWPVGDCKKSTSQYRCPE